MFHNIFFHFFMYRNLSLFISAAVLAFLNDILYYAFIMWITEIDKCYFYQSDDDEANESRPSSIYLSKMGPDDVQLHVQSEQGTGGHWCAKVFFFSLLVVLLGLICLILMENRGLDDRKFLKNEF